MPRALALALLLLSAGCAAAPRDNAENVCMFMFLAEMPNPFGVIVGAAMCTFGLEMLPAAPEDGGACDEDDEDCEGDEGASIRV